jgi:hypothetical protein
MIKMKVLACSLFIVMGAQSVYLYAESASNNASVSNAELMARLNSMQAQINEQAAQNKLLRQELQSIKKTNNIQNTKLAKIKYQPIDRQEDQAVTKSSKSGSNEASLFVSIVRDDLEFDQSGWYKAFPDQNAPLHTLKAQKYFPNNSLIFGGLLETDLTGFWGQNLDKSGSTRLAKGGNYNNGYNFNITKGNFDIISNWGGWVQTVFTLNGTDIQGDTLLNAFVTLGNLQNSPFFLTLGKNRAPMGTYAGSAPLLKGFAKAFYRPPQFANILFGFDKDLNDDNNLNLNVSFFNPAVNTSDNNASEENGNFLVSAFYTGKQALAGDKLSYGLNTSYMYSSSGTGMGSAQFINPAGDVKSRTGISPVYGLEGNVALNQVELDLGFFMNLYEHSYTNNSRANIWYAQLKYKPEIEIFDDKQPTTFALAYNHGSNTQEFTMPLAGQPAFGPVINNIEQEINAYVQRPIFFENLVFGLEYGWLGFYNGGGTSEVTLDTRVYF